jgi:hypothetical protein
LTPEDREIARQTAEDRPVMFLGMALEVVAECLSDFRRASDRAELAFLGDRLTRVVARTLDGATADEFRARYTVPTRVRLVLLGAARVDAERLSTAAVDSILDLTREGPQPSPRLCRHDVTQFVDRNTVTRRWDANARWLATAGTLRAELGVYLHHELRAFPLDPPPDPLLAARGPRYQPARPEARSTGPLEPLTAAAVEKATRHAEALLAWSRLVVDKATRAAGDADGTTADDLGQYAAEQWESLGEELHQSGCFDPLRDHLHLIREENYVVADVVAPSAHEATRELARRVWMAFRSGVCATADGIEAERRFHGPWQGHEIVAALAWFRREASALVHALGQVGSHALGADLKRESARLKRLVPPAAPPQTPDRLTEAPLPQGPQSLEAKPVSVPAADRSAEVGRNCGPEHPDTEQGDTGIEAQVNLRLLSVFTNGVADERMTRAFRLLADPSLTVNEKLTRIDALIRFPATASAEQLGVMLGVSKQAVLKSEWWVQNRKGEKASEIGRRRTGHERRAEEYRTPKPRKDNE